MRGGEGGGRSFGVVARVTGFACGEPLVHSRTGDGAADMGDELVAVASCCVVEGGDVEPIWEGDAVEHGGDDVV